MTRRRNGQRTRRTDIVAGVAFGLAFAICALAASPAGALSGQLDPAFAAAGMRTTDFGGTYDWAYATAVQPDGAIVAAGQSNASGTHDFAVARYTAAGALDPSFGRGGLVATDFGKSDDRILALALQPDGRIVVAGVSDRSGSKDFALARYNTDGSLDPTFGNGGLVLLPVRPLTTDIVRGVAIQPDGKILAAGVTYDDAVSLRPHGDFMLVRYTREGGVDPSFGVGGIVTTNFEGESYDEPHSIVLQPDSRIILGGSSNTGGGVGRIFGADNLALARYLPTGLLDPTFGQTGKVVVDAGSLFESIRAMTIDPAGRIVAAGRTSGERRGDLLLSRFQTDGTLDASFGRRGLTITDLGTGEEGLTGLALAHDGTIVAGGIVAPNPHGDLAVVRYDTTGQFDRSFGEGGFASVDVGKRDDRLRGLALQPDGNVVVVGSSETDFVVARFTDPTR
jgi:uncharacterized delta-60 repeat protein